MNEQPDAQAQKWRKVLIFHSFIHSVVHSFSHLRASLQQQQTSTTHKEKALITLTIRVKSILRALGYTTAILMGAFIFAQFLWAATGSGVLGGLAFWGGLFLGILAVLTDELQKREAPLMQQSHEPTTVTAHPNAPVLTQYVPGTFQVSTKTFVDLNLGIFALKLALRTDLERSKSVHIEQAPINQIIQTERKHLS